ncbi:regulator [Staphylococcus equorum]|uniref:regulator n=1 Tax=Staphylococcus equorum TaxID=246432 RepID=UPI002553EDE9|nr:regulator [Staphylococcus equorum]MDK9847684.1 regulator [Staphylococcus equorum]
MNNNENNESSSIFQRKKKVSLHLLVDPDMKDFIVKYANANDFDNISQAGREVLKKGIEQIKKNNK